MEKYKAVFFLTGLFLIVVASFSFFSVAKPELLSSLIAIEPPSLIESISIAILGLFSLLFGVGLILAVIQMSLQSPPNESWRKFKKSHGACACPKCMKERQKKPKN